MRVDFLIVGTPRSGTTLVQRLACEVEDVATPPETHFFSRLLPTARPRLPLGPSEVERLVARFLELPTSRDLVLDPGRVARLLGDGCWSLVHLFAALVSELSGPSHLLGEKTPEHLVWWRAVAREVPELKLIFVVRDPRAVMASHQRVPWGIRPLLHLAEQWKADVRQAWEAGKTLGPRRCLLVRFEDAVHAPFETRERIASFLDSHPRSGPPPGPGIVAGWEWWKQAALGPVDRGRTDGWAEQLDPELVADLSAVCRGPMEQLGYDHRLPTEEEAQGRVEAMGDEAAQVRARYRRQLARRIERALAFPLSI